MVKTRHRSEPDDEAYSEFITLATRRTRSSQQYEPRMNGYHGGSEDESDGHEETLPPKRTRAGQHNISIFAGNTTDDETPPRNSRRKRYRNVPAESRQETILSSGRSHRQRAKQEEEEEYIDPEEEDDSHICRRSTRQRKLVYDTFNQNLIHKQLAFYAPEHKMYEDVEKPSKKPRLEDHPVDEGVDMYTRVKRERLHVKRDMYGVPVQDKDDKEQETATSDSSSEEVDEEESEEEQASARQYFLREHKPRTNIYMAPIEPKRSRPTNMFRDSSPPHRSNRCSVSYSSPARRKSIRSRRKAAFHGSSSTSSSSSSDGSDGDERRFERRKAKSMAKSRTRCLPMNVVPEDISTGLMRDRTKIGSSLADVDPMNIDKSVTFDSVGGLGKHVRSLKEMVVFPLLYPEVFQRFHITPPRGVLFYGPPGTGKTLVARALANECSSGDRRVAFFMRKGADCLSKWVGESERQLRLLFDQAYQMRPSIIFFDEIDGLAPVRSSRQDQIHSSIVSTLLALMDGLDNRGEIVVIGATNRLDSIDPALRRPGRFDREFPFPLPSLQSRIQILKIHTKEWKPPLSDAFIQELAGKCAGYCGADLKALCTEACLHALRRRYPQIYNSKDKLQLDVESIRISANDFQKATGVIVPTSQRSVMTPAKALSPAIQPLLLNTLNSALQVLQRIFPIALSHLSQEDAGGVVIEEEDGLYSDEEENEPDIYDHTNRSRGKRRLEMNDAHPGPFLTNSSGLSHGPASYRPRLLLVGEEGQGQTTHLAPSILHQMERLPVHVLDLPALYAVSARTPEESCAQIFREARRTCPSIIYVPHINQWWEVIGDATRATFMTLLQDQDPSAQLLLLATNDEQHTLLPHVLRRLFSPAAGEVIVMKDPTESERREYFSDLLLKQACRQPPTRKQAAKRVLEVLPRAPTPEPAKLTETETKRLQEQEESTLRELRLFLRDVLNKLGRDRKFAIFTKPVDEEEVPDYYDVIANPMDLSTMMNKIDLHKYQTIKDFMDDIELIISNCLEYNPDKNPADRAIRHRACTLKDTAQAILKAELDEDFEKLCEEIKASRERRGEKASATVPSYYFTKPLGRGMKNLLQDDAQSSNGSKPSSLNTQASVFNNESLDSEVVPKVRMVVKKILLPRKSANRLVKSPWCRSTKRRYKKVTVFLDEFGNEIPQDGEVKDDEEDEDEEDGRQGENNEKIDKKEETENIKNDEDKLGHFEPQKMDTNENVEKSARVACSSSSRETACSPKPCRGSPRSNRSPRLNHSPAERSPRLRSKDEASDHPKTSPNAEGEEITNRTRRVSENERADAGDNKSSEAVSMETEKKSPQNAKSEKQESKKPVTETVTEANKEDDTEVPIRVTRSQLQPSTRQLAMKILEQPTPMITVDCGRLNDLLDKAVTKTNGCNIDELERLYSLISQCIYHHRYNYDKSDLLQDMETAINHFR